MKRIICLLVLAVFLLCTCGLRQLEKAEPETSLEPTVELTPIPTVEPTPQPTPEPSPEPTPEPDKFSLEGYSAQQIADYFCEVALDQEYTHGDGDSTSLKKWLQPIRYTIYGSPTAEDLAVLGDFVDSLNEIEGFPGMQPASSVVEENFVIRFLPWEEMSRDAGYVVNGEYADGIAYWNYYNANSELYNVRIWIRSDIDQYTRNSVILEEIVNSLGLGNDTVLREDSIIYQYYSEPQALTEMDWLLLRLLYNEEMLSGMHQTECREVISKLCE